LKRSDLLEIAKGITLDDGYIKVDSIAYVSDTESKKEIGIELHSGKNRIVRRIFESFDYKVVKLDRVIFASLTKKDIPRGKWRRLTEKEVNFLKML
jgi:23S rRNA pseudouridine2605 synthase